MARFRILNSTEELAQACDRARADGRVAIDTEFLWERTYAPRLCLAQLNVEGEALLADPLAGVDLSPLAELVADPDVHVIMHAPHADLVAFALEFGVTPTAVFDTQLSAGFVGLSAGLAYGRLVEALTGREVKGGESYTDWSKRPLTDRQLAYAAEDVEHLFDMTDELGVRLQKLGRIDWVREEMERRFERRDRLVTPPEEAWRKVSRRGSLRAGELRALRRLAAWRERTARQRDIPVSRVLQDASLIELARRKPGSAREVRGIRGVSGTVRDSDMARLVDEIRAAENDPQIPLPPAAPRLVQRQVNIAKGLATALLRALAEDADIAPELVGTSSDVEALARWVATGGEADEETGGEPELLRGWRRELAGEALVDLLEGRTLLQLVGRSPYLVTRPSD